MKTEQVKNGGSVTTDRQGSPWCVNLSTSSFGSVEVPSSIFLTLSSSVATSERIAVSLAESVKAWWKNTNSSISSRSMSTRDKNLGSNSTWNTFLTLAWLRTLSMRFVVKSRPELKSWITWLTKRDARKRIKSLWLTGRCSPSLMRGTWASAIGSMKSIGAQARQCWKSTWLYYSVYCKH